MDGSSVVGCSLEDVGLQRRSGASLIAVARDGKSIYRFDDDYRLRVNDLLILLGSHKALDDAMRVLKPVSAGAPS